MPFKAFLTLFIFLKPILMYYPAGIHLLKVNNRNTRRRCEIVVNNKDIKTTPGLVLVSLLIKPVSAIFYQIFISHQTIALQKL